jgi:hypothetical protein
MSAGDSRDFGRGGVIVPRGNSEGRLEGLLDGCMPCCTFPFKQTRDRGIDHEKVPRLVRYSGCKGKMD